MKITRSSIARAVEACLETGCKKATVYLDAKTVVKCTARFRPRKGSRIRDFVLTIGAPNFVERRFIRLCKKAGEPLPVGKTQLKFWPRKQAERPRSRSRS